MNVHQATQIYGKGGSQMISENKKPARKIIGSAVVNCDLLNIRKAPSTAAPILKEVKRGEKFNVTEGGSKEFTALIVDDNVVYAMTMFLDVTKN